MSSPRELSELAHRSGQTCLVCGAFLSHYAWGELATALLAVQQLSEHFCTGVNHAGWRFAGGWSCSATNPNHRSAKVFHAARSRDSPPRRPAI